MNVIYPGHTYFLQNFEAPEGEGQSLRFIRKELVNGEFITTQKGTTNEEVLEVLIDRMKCLQEKSSCRENAIVITKLEEALMWLNKRTENRIKQGVENTPNPHKS